MPAAAPKSPRSTREREARRLRILALFKSGMTYAAIAQAEALSAERIRQIVVASIEADRNALQSLDSRLVLAARLEPAFQLAARAVSEGRLEAVGPLVRVIDRLARLTPANLPRRYDENARAKLLAKINMNVERLMRAEPEKNPPEAPTTP